MSHGDKLAKLPKGFHTVATCDELSQSRYEHTPEAGATYTIGSPKYKNLKLKKKEEKKRARGPYIQEASMCPARGRGRYRGRNTTFDNSKYSAIAYGTKPIQPTIPL
jgi:hypothetical protein